MLFAIIETCGRTFTLGLVLEDLSESAYGHEAIGQLVEGTAETVHLLRV